MEHDEPGTPAHDGGAAAGEHQDRPALGAGLDGRTGVVVIGAEWVPVWRLLRSELAGTAGVWFADADADPVGADSLGIRTLPTCIVVADGREQRRVVSSVSADDVRGWVAGVRGEQARARSHREDPARDRRRTGAP